MSNQEQSGELNLPSQEAIAKLPRWAQVAFAARCARRVHSLFTYFWPNATESQAHDVEHALRIAEVAAETAQENAHALELSNRARTAGTEAGRDAGRPGATHREQTVARHACREAAFAAAQAVTAVHFSDYYESVWEDHVRDAVDAAAEAAHHVVGPRAEAAMRHDFERLRVAAERFKWTDSTSVPSDFFGPLWPDGAPRDWPCDEGDADRSRDALPTQAEIAKLPRWAQVAFAARCARRVQPLFDEFWRDEPVDVSLEWGIHFAEMCAARGGVLPQANSAWDKVSYLIGPKDPAGLTAEAASFAVDAARQADSPPAPFVTRAAECAIEAANLAFQRVVDVPHAACVPAYTAVRRDFDLLREGANREQWTDETAVPPEFFGPLWPEGAPDRWPIDDCHRDDFTHVVPRQDEVTQLPRRAQVAYAARCARRVLPMFRHLWPDAPTGQREWIDRAVTFAESTAASTVAAHEVPSSNDSSDANRAAMRATSKEADSAGVGDAVSHAARAAECAADAAYTYRAIHPTQLNREPMLSAYVAGNAAANAVAALEGVEPYQSEIANNAIRRDFELLKATAKRERWTDDMPVPLGVFGPLWPNGVPRGWPSAATGPLSTDALAGPLSVYIDPTAYSPEEAGELLAVLSDIYESISGDRLVIDGTGHARVTVGEPVLPGGGS